MEVCDFCKKRCDTHMRPGRLEVRDNNETLGCHSLTGLYCNRECLQQMIKRNKKKEGE